MIPVPREVLESWREELNSLINAACNHGMAGSYWRPAEKALTAIDKILEKNDG